MNVEKINFYPMWSILTIDQYKKVMAKGGPYEGVLKAKEEGLIEHIVASTHLNGEDIETIVKHLTSLENYSHLYMYYGIPYSEECYVYGDDEEGENLIVSYECDDLCRTIADEFQNDYEWLDILHNNQIKLEKIFEVDIETQDFDVVASLLLYLVVSITYEEKLIDALNNGYLIRLIKRLK